MTLLSSSRGRSVAAATIATLALGATGAVTAADAGTNYTPKQCNAAVNKLIKKYGGTKSVPGPHVTKKQAASNAKKVNAGLNALIKHHRCKVGG